MTKGLSAIKFLLSAKSGQRKELMEAIENISPIALTRKQAAAMLGISLVSLDRLCRRGLIRPSRALRKPLFTKAELERFLVETRSPEGGEQQ